MAWFSTRRSAVVELPDLDAGLKSGSILCISERVGMITLHYADGSMDFYKEVEVVA